MRWALPLLLGCSDYRVQTRGRIDVFEQSPAPMLDLLLVVDDAAEGTPHREALPTKLGELPGALSRAGVDWQIGVVGTGLDSPWKSERIGPELDQPTRVLEQAVAAALLRRTDGTGLDTSLLALEEGPDGAPFPREDALITVLFVADEDDASAAGAESWVDALQAWAPSGAHRATEASALVVRDPDRCAAGGFTEVEEGTRYLSAAEATGGLRRDLCAADLLGQVADLAEHSLRLQDRFVLTEAPIPGSLRVEVEGEPMGCREGWTLQATETESGERAAIVFDSKHLPPAHAQIGVAYEIGGGLPDEPWCE